MDPKEKWGFKPVRANPLGSNKYLSTTHLHKVRSKVKDKFKSKQRQGGEILPCRQLSCQLDDHLTNQEQVRQPSIQKLGHLPHQLCFSAKADSCNRTRQASTMDAARQIAQTTTPEGFEALQQGKIWSTLQQSSLLALASVKFSTEDTKLYPPLCKQHIWQQVLAKAVITRTQTIREEAAPVEMEGITFSTDVAYRAMQFTKEELVFLRKIRLEQFLCSMPWEVLHAAYAAEAVNTLQEATLTITLKEVQVQLIPTNWEDLFVKIFKLSPKHAGSGEQWELHELFPSLKTIPKGQNAVKVGDCQILGAKRPLRLLSSLFCLNTTNQYSISIPFAKHILAALNGQEVNWPLEFYEELRAEMFSLHRRIQQNKAKGIKTTIGPHLTLLIEEAQMLGKQDR